MDHQAQWDAETLAQAKVIAGDPSRLSAAQEAAKKMAEEQQERAKAMSAVAKSPTVRAPQSSGSSSPIKLNGSYT